MGIYLSTLFLDNIIPSQTKLSTKGNGLKIPNSRFKLTTNLGMYPWISLLISMSLIPYAKKEYQIRYKSKVPVTVK